MSIRILLVAVLVTCFCGVAAAKPLTVSWPATADTPQSDRSHPFTSQQEQSEPLYLFTRRGVPPVTSLESAAGFVLGLLANSEAQQWLTEAYPQQVVRVYPTVDALLQAHQSGQLHVFLASPNDVQGRPEIYRQFNPVAVAPNVVSGELADDVDKIVTQRAQMSYQVPITLTELRELSALGTIRVGVPESSRPIIFFDTEQQVQGLDADFLALIATRTPLNFSYRGCGSWDACIQALANRQIDVLSFLSDTPARREFASFTSVYWEAPWALASLEDKPVNAGHPRELTGLSVAVPRGYSNQAEISALPDVTVVLVESPRQGLQAVLEGRVDAYLDSLPLLVERMREQQTGNLHLSILHDFPGDQVNFAVRKDWPVVRDLMQRAVDTFSAADKDHITEQWFGANYEQGISFSRLRPWLLWGALFFFGIIGIFWFWNSQLRREVRRRQKAEQRMRYLARHDELTGLANRYLLRERMAQVLSAHRRHKRNFAVLFLDLDGFKSVNDDLGHDVGDDLLKQVAERLNQHVRKQDILCRFGGDEFVIVLTEQPDADTSMQVAHKLVDLIVAPYQINNGRGENVEAEVSVSIGLAMYPEHGTDAATLLRRADKAMYEVKNQGKNGVHLFAPPASEG